MPLLWAKLHNTPQLIYIRLNSSCFRFPRSKVLRGYANCPNKTAWPCSLPLSKLFHLSPSRSKYQLLSSCLARRLEFQNRSILSLWLPREVNFFVFSADIPIQLHILTDLCPEQRKRNALKRSQLRLAAQWNAAGRGTEEQTCCSVNKLNKEKIIISC